MRNLACKSSLYARVPILPTVEALKSPSVLTHSRATHDIPSSPHIFYFDHMKARLVNGVPQLPTPPYTTRDAVVNVNTGSFLSSGNDLLSRLTDVMGLYSEPQGPQQELEFNAILEPSQVLAFQLSHGSSYVGGYYQASAHATHDGFRFPTSFFLDQFLMQNVETALQLRDARLGMLADAIRKGTWAKMYALQGHRNTWYNGAMFMPASHQEWNYTETVLLPRMLHNAGK